MAKKPPRRGSATPVRNSESRDSVSVTKRSLQSLLDRARSVHISDSRLFAQRGSFLIGSAALANNDLTRSSIAEINTASLPRATTKEKSALEVENLAKQYDFIISWVRRFIASPTQSFNLTPELIRQIHKISFDGLSDRSGMLRSEGVAVSNSAFAGPPAEKVPELVDDLCNYINKKWTTSSALHLAAYVLWRLLWIHPFSDGNGRTARGLSYLVLSAKLGAVLPGTPTLPELISQSRSEYYAALETADKAARSGDIDVSAVEEFLGQLLSLQLRNIAFLPASAKARLDQIIGSRIMRASDSMRQACYRTNDPRYRLWSQGSYLALHVGADIDIRSAGERQFSYSDPFPGLLSAQDELASRKLSITDSGVILRGVNLDISRKPAFFAFPDTPFGVAQASCTGDALTYEIHGAVYCVRLGPRTTIENCHEAFEFLIGRHMRAET